VTFSGDTSNNGTDVIVGDTGIGSLSIDGGSSLSNTTGIVGNQTGSTGTVTVSGGNWTNSSTLTIGSAGNGTLNLTGNGTVFVGSGLVSLANTSGTIGTLNLGNGTAAGTLSAATITGGSGTAVVNINQSGSYTLGSNMTGSLSLNHIGTGTTTLTGTNTYTGGTTLAGGTLSLGSSQALGTEGTISFSGGSLQFTAYNTTDYSARFSQDVNQAYAIDTSDEYITLFSALTSDGGSLTKQGAGILVLTGTNTYTGNTSIISGTLVVSENSSLADSTNVSVATGATYQVDATDTIGSIAGNGTIILNGYSLTAGGSNSTTTFSGMMRDEPGYPGSFTKAGTGTLTLSGNNTYTGGTTLAGGTLSLGSNEALGTIGTLRFSGGILQFTAYNTTDYSARFSQDVNQAYAIDTSDEYITLFSALTSDGGSLTKQGTGTLTLNGGINSYTGNTSIHSGTLLVSGLLADSSNVSVATGATYELGATDTIGSIAGNGTINIYSYNLTAGGANASTTFGGVLAGTGSFTKAGTGTLTLSGNNTYTGGTTLAGGTLSLGSNEAVGTEGTLSFSGGTLQFTANNTTDYSARFSQDVNQAYAIDTNGQNITLANVLTSDGGSLTKQGTGTLTLTGNNTYTGSTTIDAGALQIGNASDSASISNSSIGYLGFDIGSNGTASVSTGGTWTTTGDLFVGYAGNGNLTVSGGTVSNVNGVIGVMAGSNGSVTISGGNWTNSGSLTIGSGGTGSLIVSGGNVSNVNGAIGYESSATISGGNWTNSGNLYIAANANSTLTITGGLVTVAGTLTKMPAGKINLNAGGTLSIGAGGTTGELNTNGNFTYNGTLIFNRTNGYTYSGNLGGSGSLIKQGSNALILTGTNTYNGTTTISSGTLQIGNSALTGSISSSSNIINNAILDFKSSNNQTYGGQISGSGALNKRQGGTLILSGNNTYTGDTMIYAGTLQIGNGGTSGSLVSNVSGGPLVFNRSDSSTYGGVFSGSTLTKLGAGALTLSGNNTYTGGTIVSAGTLAGTTSSLQGAIANSATVAFDQNTNGTYAGVMSGSGSLVKSGSGTVTLSGANSYGGGTTVNSGTLAGTTSSLQGAITNNAVVNFDQANNGTYAGVLSGTGSLVKTGSGVVTLSGNNTYTGGTQLDGGALEALHANALGNGALTLSSGTLAVGNTANPNLALTGMTDLVWSSSNAAISLAHGGNITISGNFSNGGNTGNRTLDFGTGQSLQLGNNTLVSFGATNFSASNFVATISGSNSLSGTFQILGNSLVYNLQGGSASGNVIDNSGPYDTPTWVDFTINGNTGNGTVITAGGNNTIRDLAFTNNGNLAIQAGYSLTLSQGQVAVENGSSVVGGGTLATPGNFNKTGAGELDVQSTLSVNGTASIDAGLLSVNGNLTANSVAVNSGAILGGSGTIFAPVTVSGTLAPGNSPGTLSMASLALTPTAVTDIEIESLTNFDRLVIGGAATVDGTLNVIPYNGNPLAYGQQYSFLAASGGISGEFDTITAPATFRGRFLNLGTTGFLLIAPDSYTRVAVTPNQREVAKALDSFIPATSGDQQTVSIALDLQTAEQYPTAFEQIMPGFYESLANIAIEQAFDQTQMLNQRINSVRLGAAGFQAIGGISQPLLHDKNGKSAAEAKDASPIVESATATNWNAWALGTGMFSRSTNLGSLQNYNNDAGGFLVGADYRWSENFVTGLYGGYDYSYAEYNGGGSTKGNSFSFGTYASYAKDGYYADAVIGGGYTGFQTKRSIAFGTIDRTASADPNSGQFTAGLNLGKDFEVGKFTLGPIVGAQYTYAGIGSFTESGAESLDLSLGQQNANSLRSTLGGRVAYTWNLNQKIALIPEVRMFWQHEFLNNPRNINSSLDGGSGPSFGYETTNPYRNSVFAGAGVTAQFGKNLSGSVFYNINFGSQTYQSNMVSAGLNFSF
jgi:autotransporter-associated beta strand protein/T5SS/PEP-CTERM-associated repeat protein